MDVRSKAVMMNQYNNPEVRMLIAQVLETYKVHMKPLAEIDMFMVYLLS